jgi:hypothetical protein
VRIIDGFVCVAEGMLVEPCYWFFGPPSSKAPNRFEENLTTNGLRVFVSKDEAEIAVEHIKERSYVEDAYVANLKLQIAETNDETYSPKFKKSKSLIVVWYADDGVIKLMGANTKGEVLYTTSLSENGILPFNDFNTAEYAGLEVKRQARSQTRIAIFEFERV